jgi:hypothetical protein
MLSTKIKARNTGPEKNANSKFTRGFLGSLGLLLLVLVFGASSETNAQTGQNRNDPPIDISLPENDPPENDTPGNDSLGIDPPQDDSSGPTIDFKPIGIQDDNGQITGIGIQGTIKID